MHSHTIYLCVYVQECGKSQKHNRNNSCGSFIWPSDVHHRFVQEPSFFPVQLVLDLLLTLNFRTTVTSITIYVVSVFANINQTSYGIKYIGSLRIFNIYDTRMRHSPFMYIYKKGERKMSLILWRFGSMCQECLALCVHIIRMKILR